MNRIAVIIPCYNEAATIGQVVKEFQAALPDAPLFTSDSPVYCYSPHRENLAELEEYETIMMPLTSKLVIVLHGKEMAKHHGNNRLLPIDEDGLESIKLSIAYAARTRIFSQTLLSENDQRIIEQARKDKKADETAQRGRDTLSINT